MKTQAESLAHVKRFIFLVCQPSGSAVLADISASSPAEAVRLVVAGYPNCRFNIVNIVA